MISETKYHKLSSPLKLESGVVLDDVTIAFEKYGSASQGNTILVCHALSGDAHAGGFHEGDEKPGWWDGIIGEGKALDTGKYCVIATNVIGGCKGSTGPSSINKKTGKPYRRDFPVITVTDMVNAQHQFLEELGVHELYAVIGGSMGGMQALTWAVKYPEFVRRAVVIASSGYSTPMHIAFGAVQRAAVMSDDKNGLALARMMAHITYLSDESMRKKFGRRLQENEKLEYGFDTEFSVESYLQHQGKAFTERFDPDSYLYITKAIDYYDLTKDGNLAKGLEGVSAKTLVISVSSDWLYPPYLSEEIVSALTISGKDVQYAKIISPYGHDAFLLENNQLNYIVGKFLTPKHVGDVMIKNPPVVCDCAKIQQAAEIMIEKETDHIPVVSAGGELSGIITSWDIAKSVALKKESLEEIMTKDVMTISESATINDAAHILEKYRISALPVVDNEKHVIGIITSGIISNAVGGSE